MSLAGVGANLEACALQAQTRGGIGMCPLAFEIIEGYCALGPRLASAISRVTANRTSDPAEGGIVGVRGHVKD